MPAGQAGEGFRPGQFRWHPTQRRQIHELLGQRGADLAAESLETADPKTLLGPFAQDEVAFSVEGAPTTNGKRRPSAKRRQLPHLQ